MFFNPPFFQSVKTNIGKRLLELIDKHFKRKTNSKRDQSETMCNRRDKKSCTLDGKCLQHNVVYKATIITNSETKEYIGSTGGPFKKRWYSHSSDIKNEKNNGIELSKYVWKLKNKNTNYEIK